MFLMSTDEMVLGFQGGFFSIRFLDRQMTSILRCTESWQGGENRQCFIENNERQWAHGLIKRHSPNGLVLI